MIQSNSISKNTVRRIGYAAVFGVHIVLFVFMSNLAVFEFVLDELYADVLPWVQLELIVSMILYAVYVAYDPEWFRKIGEALSSSFTLAATWVVLSVFPFQFGNLGSINGNTLATWVLRIILLLTVISVIANIAGGVTTYAKDDTEQED